MSVYKSEDAEIIFEYLKKKDAECQEWLKFSNALKRELVKGHHAQEELAVIKLKRKMHPDSSWDSISK